MGNKAVNPVRLSDQDVERIIRVVATEADFNVYKQDPEQYRMQVYGVVDTILNRVASKQFPGSVKGVANQWKQFSAINSKQKGSWGDVDRVPDSEIRKHHPVDLRKLVGEYIIARANGEKSIVGGGLHYANPYKSDKVNRVWINKLDGPTFGTGDMIHRHGTTAGFTPVEADISYTGSKYGAGASVAASAPPTTNSWLERTKNAVSEGWNSLGNNWKNMLAIAGVGMFGFLLSSFINPFTSGTESEERGFFSNLLGGLFNMLMVGTALVIGFFAFSKSETATRGREKIGLGKRPLLDLSSSETELNASNIAHARTAAKKCIKGVTCTAAEQELAALYAAAPQVTIDKLSQATAKGA